MGYFSNGTEGEMYEAKYCRRCLHYETDPDWEGHPEACCPVWLIHLMFNYEQLKNKDLETTLSLLIPKDGVYNGQCTMFKEVSDDSTPE